VAILLDAKLPLERLLLQLLLSYVRFLFSHGYHERTWHITGGLFVAIIGFVIAADTMNTAGR